MQSLENGDIEHGSVAYAVNTIHEPHRGSSSGSVSPNELGAECGITPRLTSAAPTPKGLGRASSPNTGDHSQPSNPIESTLAGNSQGGDSKTPAAVTGVERRTDCSRQRSQRTGAATGKTR